jgi:hypothetical protein
MRSPYCLCVCMSVNTWTNLYETWYFYVYYDTWTHLSGVLRKSLPSVCVTVCLSLLSLPSKGSADCILPSIVRQRLDEHVLPSTNTHNNRTIVGRVCVCLARTLPLQRRIVGGGIFYAGRVVSKEIRQLLLPELPVLQCIRERTDVCLYSF